jgi:hypothetical protein
MRNIILCAVTKSFLFIAVDKSQRNPFHSFTSERSSDRSVLQRRHSGCQFCTAPHVGHLHSVAVKLILSLPNKIVSLRVVL